MKLSDVLKSLTEHAQDASEHLHKRYLQYLDSHYDINGDLIKHRSGVAELMLLHQKPLEHRSIRLHATLPVTIADDELVVDFDSEGSDAHRVVLDIEFAPTEHVPEGVSLLKEKHVNTTPTKTQTPTGVNNQCPVF